MSVFWGLCCTSIDVPNSIYCCGVEDVLDCSGVGLLASQLTRPDVYLMSARCPCDVYLAVVRCLRDVNPVYT